MEYNRPVWGDLEDAHVPPGSERSILMYSQGRIKVGAIDAEIGPCENRQEFSGSLTDLLC